MYNLIKEEIANIRNKYLNSALEIVSNYGREKQLAKDYEGRQIFELLQNADDAAETGDGKVLITFENNRLTVSNTGEKFSFEGFQSLLYPNVSYKSTRANKIGCKGLGFRSILTWTDSVIIATEDFSIQFSKADAIDFLKGILEERPAHKAKLKDLSDDEWPIATLSSPRLLNCNELIEGFDTSIIMNCHDELSVEIEKQIKSLEFEELIFLPHLSEIEVICGDYHKTFFKFVEGNKVSIEQIDNNTNVSESAFWNIYRKNGVVKDQEGRDKDYEFIIAYDPEGNRSGNVLYSFFKTEVQLSFPALIHGTFILTSERNDLEKKNVINQQLIPLLASFMVETAVKISEEQDECDYRPLSLVITSESGIGITLKEEYSFDKLLMEKAKEKKILPTIKNEYISINESPFFSSDHFAEVLNPDVFPTLLKYSESSDIDNYLKGTLKIPFYEYEEFCDLLNCDTDYYSIDDRAWLIKLIDDEYGYYDEDDKPTIFPHLIIDNNGETITSNVKVLTFPTTEQIVSLPSWVNIRFLNQELEEKIYEYFETSNGIRHLRTELSRYNIDEYSFERVLRSVNQIDAKSLNKEKCSDVLNWLLQYYIQDESRPPIQDLKVKVICRNGELTEAKESYIGREYGNVLGERLISLYSNSFVSLDELNLNCKDINQISRFLVWIGVSKYPRIQKKTIKKKENPDFWACCYPLYVSSDDRYYDQSEFSAINTFIVGTVESFDTILEKSNFNDILAWFILDNEINIRINSDTEEENSFSIITGYPSRMQNERTVTSPYIKSYIKFILSNSTWISNEEGQKNKPEYCCFEENGLAPFIITPNIDYSYIKKIIGRTCKKQVDAILNRLGVADVFQEMRSSIIYETFMKLPELDPQCKKAKSIYRKVIRDGLEPEEYAENNPIFETFKENGRIAAKRNGIKIYAPISQVYYSDRKMFSEEILKNFNMLDVDARVGEEKIFKLFGVSPLKCKDILFEDQPVLHPLDALFKEEYSHYIPFVFACRIGLKKSETNFNDLKNTKVVLCSKINVKYIFDNGTQISELKDNEIVYFSKKDTAYICTPSRYTNINELKQDDDFCGAVAEIITLILNVYEDKGFYRDLFSDSDDKREYRMRNDKGDENLELLTEARLKFNSNIKIEDEFWRTIAEIKKLRNISISSSDAEILIKSLKLPSDIDKNINYEDLNSSESIEAMIPIFKMLDIDLDLFNSASRRSIDATNYWKNKLLNKKNAYTNKYQEFIVSEYKDHSDCVKIYKQCMHDYIYLEPGIENSLFVDIDIVFQTECGISFTELDEFDGNEAREMITKAHDIIASGQYDALKNTNTYENIEAYCIFGRIEELLHPETTNKSGLNNTPNSAVGGAKTIDRKSLVQGVMATPNMGFTDISTKAKNIGTTSKGETKPRKPHKRTHDDAEELRKDEIAAAGEAAVYKELCGIYKNVSWVSGIAAMSGFADEGDDTCGYDIKYIDDEGVLQYVEVKSSSDDEISFDISNNELRFACEHSANYEIIFAVVGKDNRLKNAPYRLGHLFEFASGEDLLHNNVFSIESEKYHIYADKKKQVVD